MTSIRLSVRWIAIVLTMLAAILLSACKANTGSTDERGLLPHLSVDMQLPEELSPGSAGHFQIAVRLGGEPVQADRVIFEFWPEGRPDQVVSVTGTPGGEGLYTAEYRPGGEGLYMVRCRVSSGPLEAMPAQRFAIGEEAVLRLAALERQQSSGATAADEGSGEHNHH